MEHTLKSPTRPRGQKQKQLFAEHLLTFVLLEEIWRERMRVKYSELIAAACSGVKVKLADLISSV